MAPIYLLSSLCEGAAFEVFVAKIVRMNFPGGNCYRSIRYHKFHFEGAVVVVSSARSSLCYEAPIFTQAG